MVSGGETVSARLGDQHLGVGWIALDLLAQAVDVGFQGVGGDAGVVAPDLVQKHFAPDHPVTGAIQVFQDRRLLVGEADFALVGVVDEKLGAGLKGIGADGEDRVVAALVLADVGAQAGQQDAKPIDLSPVPY